MAAARRRPGRRAAEVVALSTAIATVAGLALIAPGFDASRTPVDDGAVWAIQSNDDLVRYGRVNVEVAELDIIKPVDAPNAILQSPDGAVVFTSNYAKYAQVSAAEVSELLADAPALVDSPPGTRSAQAVGGTVLLHTSAGEVFVVRIGAPSDQAPQRIEIPSEGPDAEPLAWVVDAVALVPGGRAVGWNAESSRVEVYDLNSGAITETSELPSATAPRSNAQVSMVGDRWVLLDSSEGSLIIQGRESEPTSLALAGVAALQRPSIEGDDALVSDENGLFQVPLDGADAIRIVDRPVGVPATPTELDGVRWAAWLAPGAASGGLWNSATGGFTTLNYSGEDIGDEPRPVLQSTGQRMALNDQVSGWVWTIPDGSLVPTSQDWTIGESDQQQEEENDQVVSAAVDPKPPVVVDDTFGVRPGATTNLPLLLNDSDPNGDILTITPASIDGLDPAFGKVMTAADDQSAVIQVAPGASGSASFTYQAEDGTADGGLTSERAAVVTVTVVPDSQNSAPEWCGVDSCTAEKPSAQIGPGSSVEIDWLRGWVDPEGDPVFVSQVGVTGDIAVAAATDAGRVLVRHTDPNAGGGRVVLDITVSDVRGAPTRETFEVPVTSAPAIALQSFAVVAQTGVPIEIDASPYMSGGSGPLSVVEAIPAREGRGEVALNPATGVITFSASAAGSYLVDWTVSDGVREQSATLRVTLRDSGEQQLSVAPTIAFVRPQEDASVDVFSAVSNPAGAVLLLSNASAQPEPGASLFASTVGRDLLRVSGTTASSQPGLLGQVSVTVSDGTGNPESTALASVSVYLLPAPPAVAPIAIDDAVVVRAGERIDVPVLDNDVAVQGNAIAFDPRGVQAEAGLAFATARTLRLLAPEEHGEHTVRYTIYSVGFPTLAAVGTVKVTVLPSGTNDAPVPSTLIGRVIAGGSVSIPFSSLGVDPNGDEVVLDSVIDQPQRGAARVSSDGRSLVYTSVLGYAGEVSFSYRVRDTEGLTGDGVVRIGVLPTEEDPSPIAFSDYTQVTVGAESLVVVRPLQNDVDPARTRLSLLDNSPIPNVTVEVEGFEAEFAAAKDRIVSVEDDAITFRAGTELGTFSYFYDVVNERGDVARGTIVLRVVRESVASVPVVSDTVLTAENRDTFESGVDVVSGRVAWAGGDVAGLTLKLWQDIPGIDVSGSSISGPLPARRLVIPFSLEGLDFQGEQVVSYGFLIVPGPLDLPPALRTGVLTADVQERGEVTINLAEIIAVPSGATLQVDAAEVRASGQRSTAECRASGDLTVVYDAGENAPWRDFCFVPVRFAGQGAFTHLAVPVRVIPGDPQPELRSGAIEVSPGDTVTYELRQMTTWQGDIQDNAAYRVGGETGSFEIIADATTQVLSVRALDNALPGTVEVASITITNPEYEGVVPAGLTLRVGPSPAALPKGGTGTKICRAAEGTQCPIQVIGVSGEVNPLPGTPLVVTAVTQPQACPTVTFAVSGTDSITASWSQETPGAVCAASFSVRDAQNRESAAERDGTVILDFQGFPAAAASVSQIAFGDGTATLAVTPGAASASYPPLTGFVIKQGGASVATCTPLGECDQITDLENGTQLTYQAFAKNDEGESRTAPQTTAWSYVPPAPPLDAAPRPSVPQQSERTSWSGGLVDLDLVGISSDTSAVSIAVGGTAIGVYPVGTPDDTIERVPVGSNSAQTITVTAVSRFPVPVGTAPPGGTLTVAGVHGIGTPILEPVAVTFAEPGGTRTATVTATATPNGDGSSVEYAFVQGNNPGSQPNCPNDGSSDWTATATGSFTLSNRESREVLPYLVCVRSVDVNSEIYGITSSLTPARFFIEPGPPQGTSTYTVGGPSTALQGDGTTVLTWSTIAAPALSSGEGGSDPEFVVRYTYAGQVDTADFALPFGVPPGPITARLCQAEEPFRCSDQLVSVTPASGSFDRPFTLTLASCVADSSTRPVVFEPLGDVVVTATGTENGGVVDYDIQVAIGTVTQNTPVSIALCASPPTP